MTNKEAIKYLKQLYPNGGHCWLDDQRMEAIGMAVKALQEEPVSNDKVIDKEKLHQILSSLWRNDDKDGKIYYNKAIQDVQMAIDLQEEPAAKEYLCIKDFYPYEKGKVYKSIDGGFPANAKEYFKLIEVYASEDKMTISKEWFEHCKKSWYNEGYIDGEYNRDRQFEKPVSEALEEASEKFANTQDKNFLNPKIVKHIFKAGAGWMSKQFEKEEPISDDLEKAAIEYCSGNKGSDARVRAGFLAGAKWQEEKDNICYEEIFEEGAKWEAEQFEKERLKQCDTLTKEHAKIESDFVTNFIKENNCTPTFIDAIEYGMKLKLKDEK